MASVLFLPENDKNNHHLRLHSKTIMNCDLVILAKKDGSGIVYKNRYTSMRGEATVEEINALLRLSLFGEKN